MTRKPVGESRSLQLDTIVADLSEYFELTRFPADSTFSRELPLAYTRAGLMAEAFIEPAFLDTSHGLMLRNGDVVDKAYGTPFLGDETVARLVALGAQNAVVVTHHPLMMETSNRGFLPLSIASLAELKERRISAIALHAPLDVHTEISTSGSLAKQLGLRDAQRYYAFPEGCVGVHGCLPQEMTLNELIEVVRTVVDVDQCNSLARRTKVRRIGVIAGGVDLRGIQESMDLDCDALVTGTYDNRVQNNIGQWYRDQFAAFEDKITISLVECSHSASEGVVMRHEIPDLFATLFGMECEYLPQSDPWY